MFVAIQFPIADVRVFVDSDTNRVSYPTWPFPEPDRQFVRASGVVERRLQGGLESWPGEDVYCSAKRALRFKPWLDRQHLGRLGNSLYLDCAFRRFYFNGEVVARVELGLLVQESEYNGESLSMGGQDCLDLIEACLSLKMRVPKGDSQPITCELMSCGEHLAKHYLRSTTRRIGGSVAQVEDWWLSQGRPLMLIEYDVREISALPRYSQSVKPSSDFLGSLNHCRIQHGGEKIGVWFLESTPYEETDLVRRMRLHLFRLHAERECLRQVFQLIILGKLQPTARTACSDRIQRYLRDSIHLLSRESPYGLSQSKTLEEAQKAEDLVSPGERATLLAYLSRLDIRRTIYRNVEGYTSGGDDAAQIVNILGGNVAVNVAKEQRIGGTQMSTYEIKFGDNTKISGDFVVANTIQGSFNKISSADTSPDIKQKLEELSEAVAEMCNHLPVDKARDAAQDLNTLTDEALKEEPRRKWYQLSAEELIKAAQTVGQVATPVISIIGSLLPLLAA